MAEVVLYDFWRSSAAYRVRIALGELGIAYRSVPVDLTAGEHIGEAHRTRNPQGLVPVLDIDGERLTQSVAIIEYLDRTSSAGFLPADPAAAARQRALAHVIAMDIHPVCNLGVVRRVMDGADDPDATRAQWMDFFISRGLEAFEELLARTKPAPFCNGARPGLADFCLIPQLYNARRWGVRYSHLPRIAAVEAAGAERAAFRAAYPSNPAA